jgi:predicted metal-dependent peptidase
MLGEAPKTDLVDALTEGDKSGAVELVRQRKLHTYEKEMAKKGIKRGDKAHRMAFDYALIWLYENRPFYVYMFDDIIRKESYDIDTLCVTIKRGRVEMWYNPDFMAIHTLKQNVGFLQHELGHVIQGHLLVGKKAGPKFFQDPINNIAMDLAVDTLIQHTGDQPDWVLMPSKLRIPEEGVDEKEWETFKERMTWEYYRDLLEMMREKYPQQFQQQVMSVVMLRPHSEGEDDSESGGGEGKDGDSGGEGEESRGSGDDHSQWAESDDPALAEEVIKATVRNAYKKAESKGRGTVPGEIMEYINALMKSSAVPFDRLLRMFIGSHIKIGRKPSMMRVSRRRRVPPGHTFERSLDVVLYRDTSGSMGTEELALIFNELWHLSKNPNVRIRVQDFDYGLEGPMRDLSTGDAKIGEKVYGRGGTSFQEPVDSAIKVRPDLALIATDGYAPFPDQPKKGVPIGWLITHGGAEPPWGLMIKLPSREEIERGHKAVVERWR